MKKACRVIAITLSAMLVLTSISYNALALRPMAHKVASGQGALFPSQEVVDKSASIKKINELLYVWNFKIYAYSHRRIYLRGLGKKTGRIFVTYRAVIRNIRKWLPSFKHKISQVAISRLENAIRLLERKKKVKKRKRVIEIPVPHEGAANRLFTSVIVEVSKLREEALRERLQYESKQPRVYYNEDEEKWYVREQDYLPSEKWETSVLSYIDQPYDTLWEAFRAVDHQIDSELDERNWLLNCLNLLERVIEETLSDKEGIKKEIDSMLSRLKKIRVEDKRIARILLENTKILIDSDRPKQVKGLLNLTKERFSHRIKEIEQIVCWLKEGRLKRLRKEADKKNEYLMDKAAKILHDLKGYHYGLTAKIIEEDFVEGRGERYLKEPDFVPFVDSIQWLHERLKGEPLDRDDVEAVKRFFLLFHDRVVASMATDNFMEDYRDEYIKVSLDPESVKKSREEVFEEVFTRYRAEDPNVKKSPKIYWTIFYQAAFVSPKIGKPGEREDNPEFLKLSDAIMKVQAKKVDIRPEGLELLLHLKDIAEESMLLTPGYLINRIDLAIAQAA